MRTGCNGSSLLITDKKSVPEKSIHIPAVGVVDDPVHKVFIFCRYGVTVKRKRFPAFELIGSAIPKRIVRVQICQCVRVDPFAHHKNIVVGDFVFLHLLTSLRSRLFSVGCRTATRHAKSSPSSCPSPTHPPAYPDTEPAALEDSRVPPHGPRRLHR